jgi:hypothetical protein
LEEIDGKRVPYLTFTRGADQAQVYILSASQFDLKAILDQAPLGKKFGSGQFTIELLPDPDRPDNPRFLYLVKHTGPLESFLNNNGGGPGEAALRPAARLTAVTFLN